MPPRKYICAVLAGILVVSLLAGQRLFYGIEAAFAHRWTRPTEEDQDLAKPENASPLDEPFPAKIWQSWKDDSEDPTERTVGFPHKWRELNPGWRYERITDENMDGYVDDRFNRNVSTLFAGLDDPILKADFLRYLILYREGGVWADIDVYPHQAVSKWIPKMHQDTVNLVVGIENDHHKDPIWPGLPYSVQLCQYTVLAKPGHPALRTLVGQVAEDLDRLLSSKEDNERVSFEDVMSTTGPFAFTKVMMEYFTEVSGVEYTGDELDSMVEAQVIGDVLLLPKDSFGWLPHENSHDKGDPEILVEHLFIGSWREGHPG